MEYPLNLLSNEELLIIAKNSDYNLMLGPFKRDSKQYAQYNSFLGTKKADSPMVRKHLPGIMVSLYRKHDVNVTKLFEQCASIISNTLMEIASSLLGDEITPKDLASLTDEQIADFIKTYIEKRTDLSNNEFDYDLFCIQMKLNGCIDIDERRESIESLSGIHKENKNVYIKEETRIVEPSKNIDDKDADTNKLDTAAIKARHKKTSAQEKAAKNKAALEAKEKASSLVKDDESNYIDHQKEKNEISDASVEYPYQMFDEPLADNREEQKMKYYIGIINIKSNYYNFTPIGIYENSSFYSLTESDIDNLFPKSQKHNINFFYNVWEESHVKFMSANFPENQPVYLFCEEDKLEENRMSDGSLNPTGYKVPAIDGYNKGIIGDLSKLGLYRLISKEDLLDDIEKRKIIKISQLDGISEGVKILVNLKEGFFAGPYTVKYSPTNYSYYIVMQAEEGKHYISGFNSNDCIKIDVETSRDVDAWIGYKHFVFYSIKDNAKQIVKDIISDSDLLESLKETLEKNTDLDYSNLNIESIVEQVGASQIVGDSLPEEIKKQRIDRIIKIMSDEEKLHQIISEASDLIFKLLINNRDNVQADQLIADMFEKHPDLLEKVQGVRTVQTKIESAMAELEQLKAQKEEKAEEMKSMQQDSVLKSQEVAASSALSAELEKKKSELNSLLERLEVVNEAIELKEKVDKLKEESAYFESHKAHLQNDARNLESNFVELVNGYSERMADITFDGFMSSKMLQAAAEWEDNNTKLQLDETINSINGIEAVVNDVEEAIDYLVNTIQSVREYSRNDILNILVCSVQGFLTVFSGTPGCGKTSICNILARTLGLNDLGDSVKRYIPVSVERGWTSKRDFIGYYNPLTKAFEESNREVFDGLRLLDAEKKKNIAKWPFYILLDEANLSSMEYYWADFMNVCDDPNYNGSINLGNNNVFSIPETLHFWATINNDHTTEILSPRLIDRAWVITLPKPKNITGKKDFQNDQLKTISWECLKKAFSSEGYDSIVFDRESKAIYDCIKEKLSKQGVFISPRVDIAIQNYWKTGASVMEEGEYGNSPSLVALDYAVAQKILPKIVGSGDEYESWLEDIRDYCEEKNLNNSSKILAQIIERGNRNMKYYQFFD